MNHNPPNLTPKVALVRCDSYDSEALDQAVNRGLDLLGGPSAFFTPGETLLIKPNVLIGDPPEKQTATNPAVFYAVAKAFQDAGVNLVYGDSPAFGPPLVSMRTSGMAAQADELGIPLADFVREQTVSYPEGQLVRQFPIAQGVMAADGVIDVAKFKTHALTRLTGAVKNLFGCVPGVIKSEFHANLQDEEQFGKMLFDLASLIHPRLCITDAIFGMEGNGPRNGTPRKIGVLIFSTDPTANDVVMSKMMALDPLLVPTLAAAEAKQPGALSNYELLGDPLDAFIMPDYQVNRNPGTTTLNKGMMHKILQKWTSPRPVIDTEKCVACGTCVKICPVTPKALSFKPGAPKSAPVYNYDHCIRCYCCQETCPYEAIYVHTPLLGKIIR